MADVPPPFPPPDPLPGRPRRRPTGTVVAIVLLVVALAGALLVAAGQRRAADDRQDEIEALKRRVARLERDRPETAGAPEPGTRDLLEGLEGLLGESGNGGLTEQFGAAASRCLQALAEPGIGAGGLGRLFAGGSEDPTVAEVAEAVEEARDLEFRSLPEPTYLTSEELGRRAATLVDAYPAAEAAADSRALVALGALPPGADLKALLAQALTSQVAGFYDPETKEMVVESGQGERLDGTARVVLSHELQHALADQVLGFPPVLEPPVPADGTEDAALASVALVEGDATLTMQRYALRNLSFGDQLSILGGAAGSEADLSGLPHHLQASLVFPYAEGLAFVCDLYAQGGWAAVDRAYDHPPTTAAQVMFPERYRAGEQAVDPRDPGTPGAGWERLDTQAFGAAELLWLLEAPGGRTEAALSKPRQRVAAWAGGELHVWGRGDDTAVGLALAQRAGDDGLCRTVRDWYLAAFPDGNEVELRPAEILAVDGDAGDAVLVCRDDDVRLGIGPDLAVARALAG